MALAMLMISVRRGTPSVTFLADTPAKWKVLSVICVVGSPMDCAATVPTTSPGAASDAMKRRLHSAAQAIEGGPVRRYSASTRLEASVERT